MAAIDSPRPSAAWWGDKVPADSRLLGVCGEWSCPPAFLLVSGHASGTERETLYVGPEGGWEGLREGKRYGGALWLGCVFCGAGLGEVGLFLVLVKGRGCVNVFDWWRKLQLITCFMLHWKEGRDWGFVLGGEDIVKDVNACAQHVWLQGDRKRLSCGTSR